MLPHDLPSLPSTILIGVGNKARHGKDTFASMLVDAFRMARVDARRFGHADAVYAVARMTKGMGAKDPKVLQDTGMEIRKKDPYLTIRTMRWAIHDVAPAVAVIPDTRFINEAEAVKAEHGFLVRVVRYRADGTMHIDPSRPADHPSEVELDGYEWDSVIENHEGPDHLKHLWNQAVNMVGFFRERHPLLRKRTIFLL
jgi:hypothetical protein